MNAETLLMPVEMDVDDKTTNCNSKRSSGSPNNSTHTKTIPLSLSPQGYPSYKDQNSEPNFELMRSFAPGERDVIKACLDRARRAKA